jgi:hypothetical protein
MNLCLGGNLIFEVGLGTSLALAAGNSGFINEANNGIVLVMGNNGASSGANKTYQKFCSYGNTIGSITANGTGAGINYNNLSDYRLKENAKPVENATAKLTALPVYEFNFKGHPDYRELGFFAHELQEAHPTLASGEKDAVDEDGNPVYQMVDYGKVTPLLAAALKESIARIDALEKKVAELEGK